MEKIHAAVARASKVVGRTSLQGLIRTEKHISSAQFLRYACASPHHKYKYAGKQNPYSPLAILRMLSATFKKGMFNALFAHIDARKEQVYALYKVEERLDAVCSMDPGQRDRWQM